MDLPFFCCASATVGSTGAGKTEPQKQQQLGTAGYAMFATVEVTQAESRSMVKASMARSHSISRLLA